MGDGKRSAAAIDSWLRGVWPPEPEPEPEPKPRAKAHAAATG
jgi:hypothetical protein